MKRTKQLINLKWTNSKNSIELDGFDFIEFATKFPSENIDIFTKLGFIVTGRHHSKKIFLLEQGGIKFVINAEVGTDASSFESVHGSGVCGISFRVQNSDFALQEAVKRGAEAVVCNDYGLPAIRGIGGSKIYLIDPKTAEHFSASFFETTGEIPQAKPQVTCIDHITQNVFRGNLETWAKFYERIFNFQEIRYFDIKGKKTELHGKALVSACGKIRILLNESQDEHSQIEEFLKKYNGEGIQHIALGCDDIYSVVGQIKHQGIEFQDTPDTYYDSIAKRIPNRQENLTELEKLKVLTDGGKEDSVVLQISTKEIIGPIFFEFIERKGNTGFGKGNLQILGRDDNQTQIGDMHIELGEIESSLNLHPAISACVVIVTEDRLREKQLIAYVISANSSVTSRELQSFLQPILPEDMIPTRFDFIDQFPLDSNGEVDRHALSLLNYWQQQLAGIPPLLELPTDRSHSAIQTYHEGIERFHLSSELTAKLQIICRESEASLFAILLASLAILMARYSNSQDIVIGSPIANSNPSENKPLSDFFANTLVLRTDLEGDPNFAELLQRVRQTTLDAYAHSDIQFDKLVEILQPEGSLSHNPLFQLMFILQNQTTEKRETSDLTITSLPVARSTEQCDLTLSIEEIPEGLVGFWQYNSNLFDAATIERMNGHFQTLLEGIVAKPQQPISQLPLLTASERQHLLGEWNDNYTEYPQDKCIHSLFEEQVERTPEAVAVVFEDQQLTYQELNAKANQLAHYIQQLGVQPEQLVGICVERSLETVIGILGILKAGGAYVPLDPAYPSERIAYSLRDSQVQVLLTHQKHLAELPKHEAEVVCLDRDWQAIVNQSSENIRTEVKSSNLAYVIYTSGSTGKPKGVLVPHGNVVRLFTATQDWYNFNHNDVWTLFHSYAFDFSVWELWGALIYGGKLVVVPYLVSRSPDTFYQLLEKEGVTVLNQTPSAFLQLIQVEESANITPKLNLRYVIFGGEALEFQSLRPWFERHGDRTPQLVNMYGITETTVHVTYRPITMADLEQCSSAIGCLIPDLKLYLLDSYLQPVPIGVVGEMYVGGAGVARGYLNREELTKQRFISNPFSNDLESKLYKTGDLARYSANGELEYLGRIDNQVKIRGFRIELGEIQAVLSRHPNISETVVIAREDVPGDKRLVAYVVSRQEQLQSSDLRSFLKEGLPNYMIPSAFVFLDTMPLTPNGKVDKRALPAPSFEGSEAEYVGSKTPTEEKVARIWKEVLNLERVGVNDNFFDLGGHSLLATQIISRIRQSLEVEVSIASLFAHLTIAELARQIDTASSKNAVVPILPTPRQEKIPLSFTQQGLWFLYQLEPESSAYNIPLALEMKGVLDIDVLKGAIAETVRRHEILRTNFELIDNTPVQVISPTKDIPLTVVDLRFLSASERISKLPNLMEVEINRSFDLSQEALLRTFLFQQTPDTQVLLVIMHHIVSDGWSLEIFTKELSAIYTASLDEQSSPLAELSIQYADFALWQQKHLQGEIYETQLNYWQQQLLGLPPLLELPLDKPRPAIQTFDGGIERFCLSRELTDKLQTISKQSGATLFMTLLTAFATLLSRYSNSQDIAIGSPIANRNRSELEPLIGFFVNTLVLRTNLEGEPSFEQLLQRVRSVTLDAYVHQDLPFDKLVEEINPERSLSYNPLFQVFFNMLNIEETQVELPGLKTELISRGETSTSKFDLTLYATEKKQGIQLKLVYKTDLFAPERMQVLLAQFHHLLGQIVAAPDKAISSYSLVTPSSKFLLPDPSTVLPEPEYELVTTMFSSWANRTPEQAAICQGNSTWNYGDLYQTAQTLAKILLANRIERGDVVAVSGTRSFGLIASMIGVFLSGGVFLNVDPKLPSHRQQIMLQTAKAKYLLYVGSQLPDGESVGDLVSICVEPETGKAINFQDDSFSVTQLPKIASDDPAYVFFTSGTTGVPKGVLGCHKGLSHFLTWQRQRFEIDSQDRIGQLIAPSFDAVLRDIFLPLTSGATLCLPPEEDILEPSLILSWLERERISAFHTVPALAESWLTSVPTGVSLRSLRWLFFAGEPLKGTLIQKWRETFPQAGEIINFYGSTETTLIKCCYQVPDEPRLGIQSIGFPLPQTQALVLGINDRLCGIGEAGEIVIRTPFRSLGYINSAEENQARFVKNPYSNDERDLLYYTGDLGRYNPDGSLEILGRLDHQVKIRGVRIEPGEIEAVLSQHPNVLRNIVITREDTPGDKRLTAYIVPQIEQLQSSDLRSFMAERLPNYMVPSAFVFLDTMPLTPNGKLDRRALPAPDNSRQEPSSTFVVPQDKLESHLTQIWERVLNIQPIGVEDNFFELGGNSLQAVTLFAQIEKQFGKKLPLATLFQRSTVAEIAQIIRQKKWLAPWESLVPIQPNGNKPPLFYIHGGGGNLLIYRDLANSLGLDQPVYGLQPRGLDGKYVPFTRIEDMAAYYLAQIRKLQPNGPYFLAGLSSGGTIAWEIAQLLKARGQEVSLLALFDSSGPNYYKILPPLPRLLSVFKWVMLNSVTRLSLLPQKLVYNLRQLGTKQTSTKILENLGIVKRVLDEDQKVNKQKMRRNFDVRLAEYKSVSNNISYLERWINSLAIFLLKRFARGLYINTFVKALSNDDIITVGPTNEINELPETLKQVQQGNIAAKRNYVPQAYSDKVILFRATKRPPGFYYDPQLGWGDLAVGGMEIYDIPGDHTSIMKSSILAEQLKICLDKAQADIV